MEIKRIVVLAFPRSGTGTMARIHNLGHEVEGENGTSNWMLVPSFKRGEEKLIHVIRNPLESIASNLFTSGVESLQLIQKGAGLSPKEGIVNKSILSTIVEGWVYWNKKIESLNPDEVICIETVLEKHNTRPHPKLTWEDMECLPVEILNKLRGVANKYGYQTYD